LFEVFEICGQPSIGRRRKRRADGAGHSARKHGSAPWPVVRGQTHDHDGSDTLPSVGVADVVRRIRIAVNETFGFWNALSRNECSSFTAIHSMCWNGTNLVRYVIIRF